jgi:hypothetical protein
MLSSLRRDIRLHPPRMLSRRALPIAVALATLAPLLTLGAQARTYTLLGDARSVQPTPDGVLLRAEHGSVLTSSPDFVAPSRGFPDPSFPRCAVVILVVASP